MKYSKKLEFVEKLRPIDDVFFEVLASNTAVCREILATILEDPGLEVENVVTQSSERNLYGRSVRLDVLCSLSNGVMCNIEVQRSDSDDHLRRVRYNASMITTRVSETRMDFADVVELYVVYISEFDLFGRGKTIYHMDKTLRETGELVDDGLHEIFVNAAINDGSDIAELMTCFMQSEVNNPKFPELTKEMFRLKHTEGGLRAMSAVSEMLREEGRLEVLINLVMEGLLSPAFVADKLGITIAEVERLVAEK